MVDDARDFICMTRDVCDAEDSICLTRVVLWCGRFYMLDRRNIADVGDCIGLTG